MKRSSRNNRKALAWGLLILAAVTHLVPDWTAFPKAVFYILRGYEGFFLFLVIGVLARSREVWIACAYGMLEEGETAACRLALPLDKTPVVEALQGLCGQGWYQWGPAVVALICVVLISSEGPS